MDHTVQNYGFKTFHTLISFALGFSLAEPCGYDELSGEGVLSVVPKRRRNTTRAQSWCVTAAQQRPLCLVPAVLHHPIPPRNRLCRQVRKIRKCSTRCRVQYSLTVLNLGLKHHAFLFMMQALINKLRIFSATWARWVSCWSPRMWSFASVLGKASPSCMSWPERRMRSVQCISQHQA